MSDLPEWHNDVAMYSWLGSHLEGLPTTRVPYLEIAKQAAREGDPEPLRKITPDRAEFIFSPPWPKGKHRPSKEVAMSHAARMEAAARDVVRIRSLWREHYGKIKRHPDATWFAAQFWDVDEEKLRERIKAPNKNS